MSIFFGNKGISVYDYTTEIENKDLLWISYDKNIPSNFRGNALDYHLTNLVR